VAAAEEAVKVVTVMSVAGQKADTGTLLGSGRV